MSNELMPAAPLMTVDMYFGTPQTVLPAELKFGALRVADAPTPNHLSVVAQLFVHCERTFSSESWGECGCRHSMS
jgi:hypothetical protein